MKYCIYLNIDSSEWDYLRRNENSPEGQWTSSDPVWLFDTVEEAQEQQKKWNTATVMEYAEK